MRNTGKKLNVAVPNTPTVLATIDTKAVTALMKVHVAVAGHALSAFYMEGKLTNDAPYINILIYDAGGGSAMPVGDVIVDLGSLGFASVKITAASLDAAGSTVSLYWATI